MERIEYFNPDLDAFWTRPEVSSSGSTFLSPGPSRLSMINLPNDPESWILEAQVLKTSRGCGTSSWLNSWNKIGSCGIIFVVLTLCFELLRICSFNVNRKIG